MRLRIAEIREYPVTHVLRDEPTGLGDLLGAAAMIRADDLAHVLGVEASGERGRADEIAEHDGELAAFGVVLGGAAGRRNSLGWRCSRTRIGAQRGDGIEQLTSVPDDTYPKV